MSEYEKLIFLDKLRDDYNLISMDTLTRLDGDYDFTNSLDPKILQRWLWLGITLDYAPAMEQAKQFVSTQGKTENLQFIYQALVDKGKVYQAHQWLDANRNFYHKSAIAKIEKIFIAQFE